MTEHAFSRKNVNPLMFRTARHPIGPDCLPLQRSEHAAGVTPSHTLHEARKRRGSARSAPHAISGERRNIAIPTSVAFLQKASRRHHRDPASSPNSPR
jgi:hypothetical protein